MVSARRPVSTESVRSTAVTMSARNIVDNVIYTAKESVRSQVVIMSTISITH